MENGTIYWKKDMQTQQTLKRKKTGIQIGKETYRQKDKPINKGAEGEAWRQTDKNTDRQPNINDHTVSS